MAVAAESDIAMVELRNVDNTAPARHGAMTAVPGPFLMHATGVAADPRARARTEPALAAIREITASADVGLTAASFTDGRAGVEHALNSTALQQLARVCSVIDPEGRFGPSRIVRGTEAV
ncbi:hypothetical protein [Mycolicibacterium hodleri]|uniref:Uncharacterized protein n=1 Tax=Mycolicibacterium hodleri TaxID=49897 RepID=A0A502DLP6_9MYCO|nr:hypothetical protein [Mycolicibacterium hodleri]TPG25580.1 hypothetical protein EAH80_30150 [Mycolicibacterium hodleri]